MDALTDVNIYFYYNLTSVITLQFGIKYLWMPMMQDIT